MSSLQSNKSNTKKSALASLARTVKNAVSSLPKRKSVFIQRSVRKPKAQARIGMSSARRIPVAVSMVNDGVNTGSVWRGCNEERVTFPVAREKYADLTSTGLTFQMLSQVFLNPGNSSLFPVFSQIASCYEEYIPNVLRVYYRTKEYTASGNTVSAGLVGMAANFDANDSNFAAMTPLENYAHSVSGAPFSGVMCLDVLEMHKRRYRGSKRDIALNNLYVFHSANSIGPTTDQAKWYDLANLQVACDGTQAGVIGELWIEYSFTMIRRKSPENGPSGSLYAHLRNYADNATDAAELGLTPLTSISTGAGSTLTTAAMDSPFTAYTGSTVGLSDSAPTVFNLPNIDATWLVVAYWSGALTVAAAPTLTNTGAGTKPAIWGPAGASLAVGHFLAAGTSGSISAVFTSVRTPTSAVTASTNAITAGGLTGMTSGNLDIFIVRVPDGITVVTDRLAVLEQQLARLIASQATKSRLRSAASPGSESDFEESFSSGDPCPHIIQEDPVLSRSTLGMIGELIARKSVGQKKA